ncbi:MAG: EscU/YscU/HrcU family type III secretion system export apparatus switch protein [Eubacterium sp.]|nr:EscU/YscU/HrcU family type III secretion system export apparatus switch protein [Eubacterium sp.]
MADFDKNKRAVALEYQVGDQAPKVVATGQGHIAQKIIETAQDANVPVHKDEKLASSLSLLDVGEYIPPELYGIVAEVLVYVDDMEKIQRKIQR